ncbi:MAG TPA: threonine/serine dehydratase [Caulobacteraceae bacterium]
MSEAALITLAAIEAARARIAPYVSPTPLVAMNPSGLWLKAESLQPIGAFKLRGAFNALLSLTPEARAAGVVAHSSGNHAQAVAYAAARLGIHATIVMPADAPSPKIAGVRREGAEIVMVGAASAERAQTARDLAAERGVALIEPFDMDEIMAGTGTIGLEILDQAPDVETVFAPVSGGGLLGGLAAAIKLTRPGVKVIGVEPERAADAHASFRAGHVVSITAEQAASTLADGLRVQRLGARTWPHIRAYVDDIVTVSEAAMRAAMRRIAAEARLIAEPSGAVAIAGALAHGSDPRRGVAVLSGGNVEPALYAAILAEG